MKTIAVVSGGNSGEYEVSIRSGQMVMKTLDQSLFKAYSVIIRGNDWFAETEVGNLTIDKNDFSFRFGNSKIVFDAVYLIIHGSPGEDGKIQGYFDLIGMPYTSPGLTCCVITMNKALSKALIAQNGIKTAASLVLRKGQEYSEKEILEKTGLPLFIKPNNGGSSVATAKIYKESEIAAAIIDSFQHDHETLCEEFVEGREVTCGIFEKDGSLVCLPITEIIPHNDFFDYRAKYMGESDEVTPAKLDVNMVQKLNELTCKSYRILQCEGLVRIDFIIKNGEPYFMEVNTIPGFSEQSIVPQQIRAAGLSERDVLTGLINDCIAKKKKLKLAKRPV